MGLSGRDEMEVSSLVAPLSAVIRSGPAPAVVVRVKLALERRYRELREFAEKHPEALPDGTKPGNHDDYVSVFVDNYIEDYRIRATQMLCAIDSPNAHNELQAIRQFLVKSPEALRRAIECPEPSRTSPAPIQP
jgi:hypothetical protein